MSRCKCVVRTIPAWAYVSVGAHLQIPSRGTQFPAVSWAALTVLAWAVTDGALPHCRIAALPHCRQHASLGFPRQVRLNCQQRGSLVLLAMWQLKECRH